MTSLSYSQIRRELEQMQRELRPKADRKDPLLDFGLLILLYFCALVFIVTVMLAAGVALQKYTVLCAVPLAWLGLAWLRRAPVYALVISVTGVAFLAACSLLAAQVFDVAWDSNSYYKVETGLLAYGWNPFRQTLSSFANATDYLPYNSLWLEYQAEAQPKATFIIGAGFYAFTGNIAYGKVFNLAGMAAAVCIAAPMVKDAFKLNTVTAFLAVLLISANPVTLAQALTYCNDGFMFQMLTVAAAALMYLALKPEGRYARMAKAAAFAAVCLAVNTKMAALAYCAIICLPYCIARVIAIARSGASAADRRRGQWQLLLYFAAMAVTAVCVLGAAAYMVNIARYGNPLHGMIGGAAASTTLDSLLSDKIQGLPLFVQFFASLFSPIQDGLFADIALKIPFTFSGGELALASADATAGGWGLLFSGIFLVSLAVILYTVFLMIKRRPRYVELLIVLLVIVFLPVFVIPYLFAARCYPQLFWLPSTALVCLFAVSDSGPAIREARLTAKGWARLLGAALSLLLIFNCVTAYNYLNTQREISIASAETLDTIVARTEQNGDVADVAPASRGLFYGLFFNLRDEGLTDYNFVEYIPADESGTVLNYLTYRLRTDDGEADAGAANFLQSLERNGYIVVIARQGAAGALNARMQTLLEALYLDDAAHDGAMDNYLAVIDSGANVGAEQSGTAAVRAQVTADGLGVQVQSTAAGASIVIGGTEYALMRDGYNIVVYDPQNMALVDSVVINTDGAPVLSR